MFNQYKFHKFVCQLSVNAKISTLLRLRENLLINTKESLKVISKTKAQGGMKVYK